MTTFDKEIILESKNSLRETLITKGTALKEKWEVETNKVEKENLHFLIHEFIKSIKRVNAEIEALENTKTED